MIQFILILTEIQKIQKAIIVIPKSTSYKKTGIFPIASATGGGKSPIASARRGKAFKERILLKLLFEITTNFNYIKD